MLSFLGSLRARATRRRFDAAALASPYAIRRMLALQALTRALDKGEAPRVAIAIARTAQRYDGPARPFTAAR